MRIGNRSLVVCLLGVCALSVELGGQTQSTDEEIRSLREQLAAQQAQIEQLRKALESQSLVLDRLARGTAAEPSATEARLIERQNAARIDELAKKTETGLKNLGGFQFTGDFRYRLDAQLRSGNEIAPPLQNVRGRYRVRLNIDKELDPRFKFHLQLSTGPFNNPITNDQDMAGLAAKHVFSIAEAWVDFHPTARFSMRGGRMEEVFADNMRFLWDDDVRFNGFHQVLKRPLSSNSLGLTEVEFRAGEYILSNPAVYVLPQNSPYLDAGYVLGQKVRGANLFHPGMILRGKLGAAWTQQITAGVELYRNPDQIQLASTSRGLPVLVNGALGLALSGPPGGTGNATTEAGGAVFSAPDYQIAHLGYRLAHKGVRLGTRELPAFLDFQVSRNVGASNLRDAFVASANLGAIKQAWDVRALYQFSIKDANSMISQFTDDDLGTGSGVNLAVHALRFDLGLTRFLQWQNLLFIQNQRRASNPAEQFFVPLQRGANPTFRYLGQLAFSF